jgi:hypothetical protein
MIFQQHIHKGFFPTFFFNFLTSLVVFLGHANKIFELFIVRCNTVIDGEKINDN